MSFLIVHDRDTSNLVFGVFYILSILKLCLSSYVYNCRFKRLSSQAIKLHSKVHFFTNIIVLVSHSFGVYSILLALRLSLIEIRIIHYNQKPKIRIIWYSFDIFKKMFLPVLHLFLLRCNDFTNVHMKYIHNIHGTKVFQNGQSKICGSYPLRNSDMFA